MAENMMNSAHKATNECYRNEYDRILDDFNAQNKPPKECIRHLEGMDFSYGQAKTAVYKYRFNRNLIGKRY